MDEVIREMRLLVDSPKRDTEARNQELERTLKDVKKLLGRKTDADRMIGLARSFIARKRLEIPWRPNVLSDVLLVAPATGTFGSPIRGIEANVHADNLAGIFEARAESCAPSVFTRKRTDRNEARADKTDRPFELHWDATDLVVLTCDRADVDYLSDRGLVPMPEELGEEMNHKSAVGHLAGLFVDGDGKPVTSPRYDRCGITARQIRRVAQQAREGTTGKDSVLIATQDDDGRRLRTIRAVLEGGFVSTLVTDTDTARAVLAGTEPKRRGAGR